jgi:two-component system, sensor histidine kinase
MSARSKFSRSQYPHQFLAYARRLRWQKPRSSVNAPKARTFGWHTMPQFDSNEECLFWQERNTETLWPLQWALLLGAWGFLAFVVLDFFTKEIPWSEGMGRIMVVLALAGLYARLSQQEPAQASVLVIPVAHLAAAISAFNLIGTLLIDANPAFYAETWPGLLPIYFVTYGQLVMPILGTLLFGWLTFIALPAAGYLIGVETAALMPSCLMLFIVNLFGMYTRCQLEAYSRKSFSARRKAEVAAEQKALFMRQASHNLRQPLQALSCYSSVLDDALARHQMDEVRGTAAKLGFAIDELNDSFNRILDIANLETGKQIPCLAEVEINPILSALENQFTLQAARKGLRLKVLYRRQPPYRVKSDANILRQILGNLIDNGVKYTNRGWVLVGAVAISATQIELSVRDTGIGIQEGQSEAIFQEFHRGNRRRDDPETYGLGIGLAYAMKASEHLPGHKLTFRAKPSRGTDFQISLPIADSPTLSPLTTPSAANLAGRYVFVVDDDRDVLNALAQQMRHWGCLVDVAGSLDELRRLLADNLRPPDLLVTDFYLGQGATAHDIIAAVEADCGALPTLILSARAIPDADKQRWQDSVVLLRKPASAALLLETMGKALEKIDPPPPVASG